MFDVRVNCPTESPLAIYQPSRAIVSLPTKEIGMFELTAFIDRNRKAKLVGAIKEASRLIADCPDPQRQWLAMRQLRLLQERLKHPAI